MAAPEALRRSGQKPRGLEGPDGRAVAARPAAPHVLVRIDEEADAVLAGLGYDGLEVVEVGLVVEPRAVVLHGLPGGEEAQKGEAPAREPREVLVGLLEGEGPADEGDSLAVVEA